MTMIAAAKLDELFRPLYARARRKALMVASVPEFTKRTISIEGTASMTSLASSFSASVGAPKLNPPRAARTTASTTAGCVWPRIIGPHDCT